MIYQHRYEWIEYPSGDGWDSDFAGFRAKILVNPNGAEQRHEQRLYDASSGTDAEAQDDYLEAVAPRIIAWNLTIRDEAGNVSAIDPPAQDWQSWFALPFSLINWLRDCIHYAHLPKVRAILQGVVSTTDSTPSTGSAPENSPTPSESTPANS